MKASSLQKAHMPSSALLRTALREKKFRVLGLKRVQEARRQRNKAMTKSRRK